MLVSILNGRFFSAMARQTPLLGKAPHGRYRAQTADGANAELGHAIFPIVTQEPSGVFVPIGTGFFIAENGVFVTAAHVVEAVLEKNGNATGPFGLFQFLPDGHYYVRQIHRATRHLVADVAVGVAMPMHHNETGKPMPNKILTIASNPPPVGSAVCTYAYPKTIIEPGKPQVVRFEPGFYDGILVEHFPHGRDQVLLPGACFRTSMVVHGGASGGPVVGPSGTAFAINSTGFDDDTISYVSCVSQVLDLAIPGVILPGNATPQSVTVRQLRDRGFVRSR
jgi:hypothetical protein